MVVEGIKRVVIERVHPQVDDGSFPVKRVVGEKVVVEADVFADGHDEVQAVVLYRKEGSKGWREAPMKALLNDRWQGEFMVEEEGFYRYTVKGWVDHFSTWQKDMQKKYDAGQDIRAELLMGAELIETAAKKAPRADGKKLKDWAETLRKVKDASRGVSLAMNDDLTSLMKSNPADSFATVYERELPVIVDRSKALFSTWYEFFPRSMRSRQEVHGTFKECERLLPEIARMGFDVVYLPPIHPVGKSRKKGKNNSPVAEPEDPGSPWAIGSDEGGHKSVNPQLGAMKDFERFVRRAGEHGIEVALDLAYQCSMDHPYIKEHPEWFRWRPDGSIQYAENPPKKYEDVVPINFEAENWRQLWEELKSVVLFWIEKGVNIFRVDNPHTKPFSFWAWLIDEVKREHPQVIFLAEAFTRPKVMYRLAKIGFTQSYTYFTWRNTRQEIIGYLNELTGTEVSEYFRPNFWPNTPDILPQYLQYGGRPAFIIRLVLAATLSSNYGIYGPAFELCVSEAVEGREEYLDSEKYEIRDWELDSPGNLRDVISRLNRIRRENPALQRTRNLRFYETDNEHLLFYQKATEDLSNILLIAVNLDPFHTQSGAVRVPLEELGIDPAQPYLLHDLLGDEKHIWHGEWNRIGLNPHISPAQIFRLYSRLRRETDFDYFM